MKIMRWLLLLFIVSAILLSVFSGHKNKTKTIAHDTSGISPISVTTSTTTSSAVHNSSTSTSLTATTFDTTPPSIDIEMGTSANKQQVGNLIPAQNDPTIGLSADVAQQLYDAARPVARALATGDGRNSYPQIWSTTTIDPTKDAGSGGVYLTDIVITSENVLTIDANKGTVDIDVYYTGTTYGDLKQDFSATVHFQYANKAWSITGVN